MGSPKLQMDGEKQPLLETVKDDIARRCARLWDFAPCIPARYVLAVMSSLGFANIFLLRVNLSVALVQMDRNTASATVTNRSAKVYDWSTSEQGWVLSSFYIGYVLLQVPAGLLSQRFGGKWFMGVGVLATSVLTLLTPVAANLSVWALVAVRVLEGLFEGATYPAVQSMWGKWAPPQDRSKLLPITYLGANIGMIFGFLLSGLLCEYGFDGGWPSVFYIFGALGIVWFLFWSLLAYNSPALHPRISEAERRYIESSIGDRGDKVPIPWFEMLTSVPFWAVTVAMVTFDFSYYIAASCLPTYFNQALGLDYKNSILQNGIYSAIPFVPSIFASILVGFVADYVISLGLPTTAVRKASTIGVFSAVVFLLICAYFGNSPSAAVPLMTASVTFLSVTWQVALHPNLLELAPQYSGITMAIANTFGNIAGIVAPLFAKAIAVEPPYIKGSGAYMATYKEEWRIVFVVGAEVILFGGLVFLILSTSRKQPWAEGPARYRKMHRHSEDDIITHNCTCRDAHDRDKTVNNN